VLLPAGVPINLTLSFILFQSTCPYNIDRKNEFLHVDNKKTHS